MCKIYKFLVWTGTFLIFPFAERHTGTIRHVSIFGWSIERSFRLLCLLSRVSLCIHQSSSSSKSTGNLLNPLLIILYIRQGQKDGRVVEILSCYKIKRLYSGSGKDSSSDIPDYALCSCCCNVLLG